METILTPIEARILGCLIEKEKTTPEYYPLTLNSLTAACNQKSNRDPVMDLEGPQIEHALNSLKTKKLAWQIMTSGSRVPKYKHDMDVVYDFNPQETAIMAVLMLRGAQTVGEIKTHTARLHQFNSLEDVEPILTGLINRNDGPFVEHLQRQTGQKERRYIHLLCGIANEEQVTSTIATDTFDSSRIAELEQRVTSLEAKIVELTQKIDKMQT